MKSTYQNGSLYSTDKLKVAFRYFFIILNSLQHEWPMLTSHKFLINAMNIIQFSGSDPQ